MLTERLRRVGKNHGLANGVDMQRECVVEFLSHHLGRQHLIRYWGQ